MSDQLDHLEGTSREPIWMGAAREYEELRRLGQLPPQYALRPVIEQRTNPDGETYWAARLPYFGFFAYGETPEEATKRLGIMVGMVFERHATKVRGSL